MSLGKIVIVFVIIVILVVLSNMQVTNTTAPSTSPDEVRYVALGDSYTIGLGVAKEEAWPNLLVDSLRADGIAIGLVDNLAVTGYTSRDVIVHQLPQYRNLDPEFATLLIGANDLARGVDEDAFRKQFSEILDGILYELEDKTNLLVLTVPDFTKTPRGMMVFSDERYATRLVSYNRIITEEATRRGLPIIDLQGINEGIESDNSYFLDDGLHPTAKQYRLWAERIFPTVKDVLQR